MNFIALIGIVDHLSKTNNEYYKLKVKVEKPHYQNEEQWYELLTIDLKNEVFASQAKNISEGMIVGIKGRLCSDNGSNRIIGERLQLF